jgi:hypothetical protein
VLSGDGHNVVYHSKQVPLGGQKVIEVMQGNNRQSVFKNWETFWEWGEVVKARNLNTIHKHPV